MAEAKPIHWAADLVEALKASGTGSAKLELIRAAMVKRFNHPAHADKAADHPDRHLTSGEAVAVLERHGVGSVTVAKARALAEKGEYKVAPPVNPADALPKPPAVPAPVREDEEAEAAPALRHIAGPAPMGVRDIDTVGPKPFSPPAEEDEAADAPKKPGKGKKGEKVKDILPASDGA